MSGAAIGTTWAAAAVREGLRIKKSLGCYSFGLCTSFTRLAHTSVWSGDFQSHIWSRFVPSWILSVCPCRGCDTCNHPRGDPWLFQAPAEPGRSHRAAVWPQLWEGSAGCSFVLGSSEPWNNLVFLVPEQKLELLLFSFCWHQPWELLSVFR